MLFIIVLCFIMNDCLSVYVWFKYICDYHLIMWRKNVYKTNSAVFYNFFVCNMNVKKIRYEMLCL